MARGTVGKHIRLSRRQVRGVDRLCKKDGEDFSTHVRRALDDYLDRYESSWRKEPEPLDRAA
jgi:hypothetical protein